MQNLPQSLHFLGKNPISPDFPTDIDSNFPDPPIKDLVRRRLRTQLLDAYHSGGHIVLAAILLRLCNQR